MPDFPVRFIAEMKVYETSFFKTEEWSEKWTFLMDSTIPYVPVEESRVDFGDGKPEILARVVWNAAEKRIDCQILNVGCVRRNGPSWESFKQYSMLMGSRGFTVDKQEANRG